MSKFNYSTLDDTLFTLVSNFATTLKYDDIPKDTLHYLRLLLLDTIGVYAASQELDVSAIARMHALKIFGPTEHSSVPIPFDGRKASLGGAVFCGVTQLDNLDAHDGFNPAKGHIAAALVPAMICLANSKVRNANVHDFLTALCVGYEIAARAGIAIHATLSDYHTSGAWNTLGVVCAGAHLTKLSTNKLRNALGIAEFYAPRSQMMREITHPSMLHDGSAMGALTAIMALELADDGFLGGPSLLIEGANVTQYWNNIGKHWYINEQYIKPYPICRWAHAAIDGVLQLKAHHDIQAAQVKRIDIYTFDEGARLFSGMPNSTSQAQYSMNFAIAKAIQYAKVGVAEITGQALTETATSNLMQRIYAHTAQRHDERFPNGRWADVVITLNNGQIFKSGDINARGGPDTPLLDEEIIQKFETYAASLGNKRMEAVRDYVLNTMPQNPNASISVLLDLLTPVT